MNVNRINDQVFTEYFINVVPLSTHASYTEELEFSDKIVLPRSVLKSILRIKLPMPPQFLIMSERPFHNDIYCTSLEYSAEEGFIYLPFWMLAELGYKVLNSHKGVNRTVKVGYGLTLSALDVIIKFNTPQYAIPKCTQIEYFLEKDHNSQDIKSQLLKYLFIRENSEVSVFLNKSITILKITKVLPSPISTLNSNFQFLRVSSLPSKSKPTQYKDKASELQSSTLSNTDRLPNFKDRMPRYLKDLLKKQESQNSETLIFKKKPKIVHKKNFSCLPPESPRILTQRESTPEIIEKYIQTSSKAMETGKSIEECELHLPSVYNSPFKYKLSPPTIMNINIPEHPNKSPARKTLKLTYGYKVKKQRSITPLILKKIKIDGGGVLFKDDIEYKCIKGIKLFNH